MDNDKKVVSIETINKHIADSVAEATKSVMAEFAEIKEAQKVDVSEISKEKAAEYFVRIALASVESQAKAAKHQTLVGSIAEDAMNTLEKRYGLTDPKFVATVKDLTATGNGGQLVDETWASAFISQLLDPSILGKIGVSFMPTESGNLNLPKILEGTAAGYVGEGGTIDTSSMLFGHIRLSVKKLMAMVPVSNDLIRTSSRDVVALVREDMGRSMTAAMDNTFLYGKGGNWEPLGINNIEGTVSMPAGQVPSRKLGLQMLAELGKRNHGMDDLVWVMGWDTYLNLQLEGNDEGQLYNMAELNQHRFVGHPIVVTNFIKQTGDNEDFFLIKKNDIVGIQKMGIRLEASAEASIPTKDGVISAFAQDYTIVKGIAENDFALAHKSSLVKASVKVK